MKNNFYNKTAAVKTAKDIFNLLGAKEKKTGGGSINPPKGETETALFSIVSGLVGRSDFSVEDDFFHIGGNSIKAVQLVSRINKQFSVDFQLTDVFLKPTVAQMAVVLEGQKKVSIPSIITINPKPAKIPLSYSQERIWFIDQLEGSIQYHIPGVLRLKGDIDHAALSNAFKNIISRHEVLRTVFLQEEGKAYQQIRDDDEWELLLIDGSQYKDDKNSLQDYVQQLIKKPFDLSKDYMLRAHLLKLSEQEHVLEVTMHHIASDGWSLTVIVKELAELYSSYSGNGPGLTPLQIQYADYALWQRNYLQGEVLNNKLGYWKQKLEGVEALQLPLDFVRPATLRAEGGAARFSVEKDLLVQLQQLSQQQGSTLFMTLLAAFKTLLYRYSGQKDISVGTPTANRTNEEVENLVGFFVNTLALRDEVRADMPFTTLLKQVRETTLGAYEHQDVPFEKVVDAVVKERNLSRSPLFQVMLVFQNTPEMPSLKLGNVELLNEPFESGVSKFEISFFITETANGLHGFVQYSTDLYKAETIERMTGHFRELLSAVVKDPSQKVGLLRMLSDSEEQLLRKQINISTADYPKEATVVSLFEEQVQKTPEGVAVVYEGEEWSYRQLNERANKLAHYLRQKGVKSQTPVPLCIERGGLMMIGMLGILKAGGAYVPVDTDFPEERIAYMLSDTGSPVVVSSEESSWKVSGDGDAEIIEIDGDWLALSLQSPANPEVDIKSSDLAYIIYTSGSTGRPKGVMIEHGSIVDYVWGLNQKVQLEACTTFALVSTIATDLGNTVIFGSLLTGGALHVFSKDAVSDSEYLYDYFKEHSIDCVKIVPSHWKALSAGDRLLLPNKLLVFGGESLQTELVEEIWSSGSGCRVVNHYGPTETTIGKLLHVTDPGREYGSRIPVGKPFSNTRVYILSPELQLSPVGVAGQLYIAGRGVARGYHNNEQLSSERFIADPFERDGTVMYATGDLVKYERDGNIAFIGRVDDQVKIRGYRIEPSEIESVLQQCEGVRQGVVQARADRQGNLRLAGYVVAEGEYDREGIMEYLRKSLPEYMVPSVLMELESLPLTANGKVDRKALPDPEGGDQLTGGYVAPQTEVEEKLTAIWQKVLGKEKVGVEDNFFELGGDSILTIQVVSQVRRLGYELLPKDIFIHQTVKGIAGVIAGRAKALIPGEQDFLKGVSGLLPIQQWYLEKDLPEVAHFNQSIILAIDKGFTVPELQVAMEQLILNHDALRFRYYKKDGQWQQEYSSYVENLITEDLSEISPDSLSSYITGKSNEYQRSLNLEKGKIIKVVLFKTPEKEAENKLLFVIHHLSVDGVSWRIILNDLEILLAKTGSNQKQKLGYKSSSYRQWFNALEKYGQSQQLISQKKYWQKVIQSAEAFITETTNVIKAKDIDNYSVKLGSELTQTLLNIAPRVYLTEINDVLISALAKTLIEWKKSDKIIICLEGHGREDIFEQVDVSRTVGWFTTHYPVLLEKPVTEDAGGWIKTTKEILRQVPDKGLGYGVLKYLNKEEEFQVENPWDVKFNYLGQSDNLINSNSFSISNDSGGSSRSEEYIVSEKLVVDCYIQGGELKLNWGYSTKHLNQDAIISLARNYLSNLESLLANCKDLKNTGEVIQTPSDFGLSECISINELDIFLEEKVNGKKRKESIGALYRLSGLQEGMLFHGLYDEKAGGYIEQLSCTLTGISVDAFVKSWENVIQHHSILRSAFFYDKFSVPVQTVYRKVDLPVEVLDYRHLDHEEQVAAIEQYGKEDANKSFDFKTAPLMRISLLRTGEDQYRMFWTSHHILFDGWSRQVLMEEFLNTYELLLAGKELPLTEEDRYEDYIRYIEHIDKAQEEQYWRNYLKGLEQGTLLPFIGSTSERTKGAGTYRSLSLQIDATATARVQSFAQRNRVTVNTVMQGVWSYLLHKYTGNDNIAYGVVVSGRPDSLANVEKRVGLYINTLPLHSHLQEEQKVSDWLQALQAEQVSSRQYEHTRLQQIQQWSEVQGDLFDTVIVFENYPLADVISAKSWPIKIGKVNMHEQTNYPLSIAIKSAEQISIHFTYNTALLKDEYVQEIHDHFEHVLLQMTERADGGLKDIKLLTKAEEDSLLVEFNNTNADYPKDKTIVDLFEEQADKTPENLALVFNEKQLTYKDLNERSNQLAHYLKGKGVTAETLVPICLDRSIEMVVGILGILKAGAAYVPIDPEYPKERKRFMVEDTGASLMIASRETKGNLEGEQLVELDNEWSVINKEPKVSLNTGVTSSHLAYVIYTSGSTGTPKGVMIEHSGVVNLIKWHHTKYKVSEESRATSMAGVGFDAFGWEIFPYLTAGASVYIINNENRVNIPWLIEKFNSSAISHSFISTALVPEFVNAVTRTEIKTLKYLLTGGDQLSPIALNSLRFEIFNNYGPTENTVVATSYKLSAEHESSIPLIGSPICNTRLYITSNSSSLLPVGLAGEICLGGASLARGYLNHDHLTNEKFIPNSIDTAAEGRIYKTGDLGRWLPSGAVEFLGRIDDQVKIRGHRIELAEIEFVIQQSEMVQQAVVIVKEDQQRSKRLVAYVVVKKGYNQDRLKDFMGSRLPEYMIPSFIMQVDSIPLTTNGKINKKALPEPDINLLLDRQYIEPRNETELKLAKIWEEVLNVERVGIEDNFFEMGGHSLLAMRLTSYIERSFSIQIKIQILFEFPTIKAFAKYLELQNGNTIAEENTAVYELLDV